MSISMYPSIRVFRDQQGLWPPHFGIEANQGIKSTLFLNVVGTSSDRINGLGGSVLIPSNIDVS